MANLTTRFLLLLGFNHQGDFGAVTTYTSARRKRLVIFTRAPALSPASPEQQQARQAWKAAAALWRLKTVEQKKLWNRLAIECRLRIHGYALFTAITYRNNQAALATLCRRAAIDPAYL